MCFNLYYLGGGGGGILLLKLLELSVLGVKRWNDMFGCVLQTIPLGVPSVG